MKQIIAVFSFDARIKTLTKLNFSHQHLSIDPKKSLSSTSTIRYPLLS